MDVRHLIEANLAYHRARPDASEQGLDGLLFIEQPSRGELEEALDLIATFHGRTVEGAADTRSLYSRFRTS